MSYLFERVSQAAFELAHAMNRTHHVHQSGEHEIGGDRDGNKY